MLDKLKDIFETQKKLGEIKKNLENILISFESSDRKIKIVINGVQKIINLDIDQCLLQPEKKEILQRALIECINSANEKVQKEATQKLSSAMGNFKIPGL